MVAASPHAAAGLDAECRTSGTTHGTPPAPVLLKRQVDQPRGQKAVALVQVAGGRGKDLNVAGPPEPLVALRAVGRKVQEVAPHAPDDVVMQPVDQRVRALEPPGPFHVTVDHDRGDVRRIERAGPPLHLDVPEAVEGEPRLPHLFSVTGQGVAVGGGRPPQRADGQFAVLEHLGMTELDRVALGTRDADADPSHQVLSEVEDGAATGGCDDLAHREFLDRPGHRADAGRGNDARRRHADRGPVAVVEPRPRPVTVGPAGRRRSRRRRCRC